ncbi:MAG: Ig-like domain-containing protein [Bacteroidaceae bacterium]|nr:Ig-like domain-containing protein [Bacteroidaceae bacterium]
MKKRADIKSILTNTALFFIISVVLLGCAAVGTPDGGPYDDTPPKVVGSSPKLEETNVKNKTVRIDFDEYIKLENASEKVIISPPQKEQPEIQVNGKDIQIKLIDSLQPNTTYTIDFSDGIVDNNEGNPLGDFCFSFSTGSQLDTMEVSGYVLNAADLEPIKGIQVGLYSNLADSAFTTQQFQRVSRTDGSGHFVIRGIKPGKYRIYALNDMDQSFSYSQRSETMAWSDSIIVPSSTEAYREDTIWNEDKITIDTILTVEYTRFLPDNIVLRAFTATPNIQYLAKSDRNTHEKIELQFAIPVDSMPVIKGLNFNEKDAYIVEHTARYDTITLWMKDTTIYYNDTLRFSLQYLATDTNGLLTDHIDTLSLTPKRSRARIVQDEQKRAKDEAEKFEKDLKRLERNGDSIGIARLMLPKTKFLPIEHTSSTMALNDTYTLSFNEPVTFMSDTAVKVLKMEDSTWVKVPFEIEQDSLLIRDYKIYAEWRPEETYKILIDSASVVGLYGLHNDALEHEIRFAPLDTYSTFTVNVANPKSSYLIELLDNKGDITRRGRIKEGKVDFFFLIPGKYYVRLIDDVNMNNKWDTGEYAEKRQPEDVYYINKVFDLKQDWYHETEMWDVLATPLNKQKPEAITKQKADKKRTITNKNKEREEKMAKQMAEQEKMKQERKEKRENRKKK